MKELEMQNGEVQDANQPCAARGCDRAATPDELYCEHHTHDRYREDDA